MPIALLRPSAVGVYDTALLGAGASKTSAVDPGSPVAHDNNGSYIYFPASPAEHPSGRYAQTFKLDLSFPPVIDAVNAVAMKAHAWGEVGFESPGGGESYHTWMRLGGVDGEIGVGSYDNPGPTYRTHTDSPYPRPGGGSWADTDFVPDNLEGAVGVQEDSACAFRITSLWAALDFDAPSAAGGAYIVMMFSLLGAAFGSAVLLHEVEAASRILARRGMLLRPHEVREAWLDLRLAPRRVTVDLGA